MLRGSRFLCGLQGGILHADRAARSIQWNLQRETQRALGIPHSTIDVRDAFQTKVIEPFIAAYMKGLTPNPCVLCNRFIKFPYLIAKADEQGAEFIATGHYARVETETTTTHQVSRSGPPWRMGG